MTLSLPLDRTADLASDVLYARLAPHADEINARLA
jgi:hypothetical protein